MTTSERTVIVVGLGRSGLAAVRLCQARGDRVIGTDSAPADRLPAAAALGAELGVELFLGGHAAVPWSAADLIVVSPGVPPFVDLSTAEAQGIPLIGELELASRYCSAPILAVGGTNGKSTVTTLLAELLRAAGGRVFAGGNLGAPLSEAVPLRESDPVYDWLVVEVSSFQLERVPTFRPKVSILLNITPDHMDRYPDFAAYARAKGNAFARQGPTDVAVVPASDRLSQEQARRGQGRWLTFGVETASEGPVDYRVTSFGVLEAESGERFELGPGLFGAHNRLNAAAAIAAARSQGVTVAAIRRGLESFTPLAHRMARVATIAGVTFYDDSKGTNVGAAVTALLGVPEPRVVMILGGRDKLGSYEPLVAALQKKGRAAVLIGEAKERLAEAIGSAVPVVRAESMQGAVTAAAELARPGDAVLLSPACSSFDMFSGYAARGDAFAAAVLALEAGGQQ